MEMFSFLVDMFSRIGTSSSKLVGFWFCPQPLGWILVHLGTWEAKVPTMWDCQSVTFHFSVSVLYPFENLVVFLQFIILYHVYIMYDMNIYTLYILFPNSCYIVWFPSLSVILCSYFAGAFWKTSRWKWCSKTVTRWQSASVMAL